MDYSRLFATIFAAVALAGVVVVTFQAGLNLMLAQNPDFSRLGLIFVIATVFITLVAAMRASRP